MITQPYSSSDHLQTDEDILEYLNAAIEDGNSRVLLLALHNVVMADAWDDQIAADVKAGRLDRILSAAQKDYDAGDLQFK